MRHIPSRYATMKFLEKILWKQGGEIQYIRVSEELIDTFQSFMCQNQPILVRELVAAEIARRKHEHSTR